MKIFLFFMVLVANIMWTGSLLWQGHFKYKSEYRDSKLFNKASRVFDCIMASISFLVLVEIPFIALLQYLGFFVWSK